MDTLESGPTHQAPAPMAATTVLDIAHSLLQPRTAEHAHRLGTGIYAAFRDPPESVFADSLLTETSTIKGSFTPLIRAEF